MGQAPPRTWAKVPAAGAAALGAGALVTSGPAAAAAGWWSLAALALAGLVALLTAVSLADLAAQSSPAAVSAHVRTRLGGLHGRMAGVLEVGGRVVAAGAVAGVAGAYAWPARPAVAAVALVAVVTALWVAEFAVPRGVRLAAIAVIIVTTALFVTTGLAIQPVGAAVAVEPGITGSDDPTGILTATGVLFFGFLNVDRVGGARARVSAYAILLVGLAYLFVSWVALRQLGGPRLAVSPTPLRDALAAADGAPLDPVLTLGVLVGAAVGLRALLGRAAEEVADLAGAGELPARFAEHRYLVAAVPAAAVAVLVTPADAVAVAATLVLGAAAFINSAARTLCRDDRSTWVRTGCCGLGLSVVVGVNISIASLAAAVAVLGVGTGLCALCARRPRTGDVR
ncbi:APA family basic amino acid/polyamine antiporter [Actinokineospora auranticolor]|uniref:APA family basic amino acid/polyamine antiporter n=2 Tax=Actinokineospora auranticolor TaxID=155976 RepID=A0A2S6GVP2_9PSEU|nr:APA family basic amino acid/polyamine antiporter [Actinokineospora auranticolor]